MKASSNAFGRCSPTSNDMTQSAGSATSWTTDRSHTKHVLLLATDSCGVAGLPSRPVAARPVPFF